MLCFVRFIELCPRYHKGSSSSSSSSSSRSLVVYFVHFKDFPWFQQTKIELHHRHFAKKAAASLGIIRLDYDYPPALGDIDHPGSFGYDVYYRVVPKLTFEMCQSGKLDDEVKENFIDAVRYLEAKGVTGITGDCGFFFWFQALARQTTKLPIYMSSLCLLPAVTCAYAKDEKIAIFTANSESLSPMRDLIRDECGVDTQDQRYVIVGCQDVDGFEAVAEGGKVDVEKVTPGVVQLAKDVVAEHPDLRAICFECTGQHPSPTHTQRRKFLHA